MDRIIISKEYSYGNVQEALKRTAIIIHVHYEDRLSVYFDFVKQLPNNIRVVFTTSNDRIGELLDDRLKDTEVNYSILMKNNRGRDVSAFFVAARNIVKEYEYVCFIHDKKEKDEAGINRVKQWNYCLWENLLANDVFINNVIYSFENQSDLGLLVPPSLMSYDGGFGYSNTWGKNYENTCNLLGSLGVDYVPDANVSPNALGTVFWVRTKAISKLISREWVYEDFDEEPLANDGTISHALERSFEFVVIDAGYKMAWAYSDKYVKEQLEFDANALKASFGKLKDDYGLNTLNRLDRFASRCDKLREFAETCDNIYIYGVGLWGKRCFRLLVASEILPAAFIVSEDIEEDNYMGIPIISLSMLEVKNTDGFIIAMSADNESEINAKLQEVGVPADKLLHLSKYKILD